MSAERSVPIWQHTDSDPAVTAQQALVAARAGTWASLDSPTRIRYLRALLVLTLQVGLLRTTAPRPRGPESEPEYGDYRASDYPDETRLWVASTLLRTPMVLVPRGHYVLQTVAKSVDGEPATFSGPGQPVETGLAPVVVVAAIAAVALVTVASEYIIGSVIDRKLEREQDTARLLGTQASAIDVVSAHLVREDKAGHHIDWSPQELAVLEALLKVQTTVTEKKQEPLPSPFPGATATLKGLGKGLEKLGEGAGAGLELLLPVAAVGALMVFWPQRMRREEMNANG